MKVNIPCLMTVMSSHLLSFSIALYSPYKESWKWKLGTLRAGIASVVVCRPNKESLRFSTEDVVLNWNAFWQVSIRQFCLNKRKVLEVSLVSIAWLGSIRWS
jgi:hypothetical protein